MPTEIQPLVIWAIAWIIIGFIVAKITVHSAVKSARNSSVKQARNVILWDVNEKLAPALPGFPYDFKDMVFIWKWIDYLVFDGLASGHLRKIILLEIKSWQSLLNRNESMIKKTVWEWLVSYEVFRVHLN
jgi:predicted Holliday junction resolvase-like endonuclease